MKAKWLIWIAVMLALSGCHSSRRVQRADGSVQSQAAVKGDPRDDVDRAVGRSLVDCARTWLGTPYRYGGTDKKGVDCSGLTTNVFSKAAGVKLPRDSRSQKDFCRRIDRRALQPGDLVFFVGAKGSNRVNHVGVYIGDGQMIHASSSRGVITSDVFTGYWADHYYASGRVDAVTYRWLGTKPPGKAAKADTKPKSEKKKEKKSGSAGLSVKNKQGNPPARQTARGQRAGTISGASAEPVPREEPQPAVQPEPMAEPVQVAEPEPVPVIVSEPTTEPQPMAEPVQVTEPEPESPWFD